MTTWTFFKAIARGEVPSFRLPGLPVGACVFGALVAGCAVGPSFKAPTPEAPGEWSAWHGGDTSLQDPALRANLAPVPDRWWETLNDPVLSALEVRAAAANPDLRIAAAHFAESRIQRRNVAAQRGPQVDGTASANRSRESEDDGTSRILTAVAPADTGQLEKLISAPYNLYQAGFDASWELDLWGHVARAAEGAEADVATSAAALAGVRIDIAAEVARNYFELRGAQKQEQLARGDVAAAERYFKLVQAREAGGIINDLETARQSALLADLRGRLPGLTYQEAQSINQLSLLLDAHPGALQTELRSAEQPAAVLLLPDLALGLPSQIALRRPDVRQAEAQLHSATAAIGVAVADLYPRITLTGNLGVEAIDASNLTAWGSRTWAIGPSLEVPIFDMGRRRGVVILRKLQQQEAAVTYQHTVLTAWHEIDTALSSYTAERQRNQELAQREKDSLTAYQLAQVCYERGLTSELDALDAERTLISVQRDYADSQSQLPLHVVAIYKALGGGTLGPEMASLR